MGTNDFKRWKTVPKSQKHVLFLFKHNKILKCLSVMSNGYFCALGMQYSNLFIYIYYPLPLEMFE